MYHIEWYSNSSLNFTTTLTILIIKPAWSINFSNLFWNKTLHVSDSSSVYHQEFFTLHTAMVYIITDLLTACEQDQDGTQWVRGKCVRFGWCRATAPSKPHTRPTQRLSGPPPSTNSVQKTIRCNLTSSAPDDGRMRTKHVELRIHQ